MTQTELNRIRELYNKIENKTITQIEKDEFVEIFYRNNVLSEKSYKSYRKNEFVDAIIRTCITLGGIIFAGILIREAIENK
ncbi:MAG: hypothetical protein LBG80_19150 [Bacteroidales bacterium]|jgi:hypothetical protein|nr:hypothetical protein [Bacteroidales bacterium]